MVSYNQPHPILSPLLPEPIWEVGQEGEEEGGRIARPHTEAVLLFTLMTNKTTHTPLCLYVCKCSSAKCKHLETLVSSFLHFKNLYISRLKERKWPGLFPTEKASQLNFCHIFYFFLKLPIGCSCSPNFTGTQSDGGHPQMTLPGHCTLPGSPSPSSSILGK